MTTTGTAPRTTAPASTTAAATAVVDGAYLLPRSLLATVRLLRGEGVRRYRASYPVGGDVAPTSSPARVATHVVAGLVLGVVTVLVVAAVALVLALSPLLLAPAGLAGVGALGAVGSAHDRMTRRLLDRGAVTRSGR